MTSMPRSTGGREQALAVAYRSSTHFRFWVFDPETLKAVREANHAQALARFPELRSVSATGGAGSAPVPPSAPSAAGAGAGAGAGSGSGSGAVAAPPPPPPAPAPTLPPPRSPMQTTGPKVGHSPSDMSLVSPPPSAKRKLEEDADMPMQSPPSAMKRQRKSAPLKLLSLAEEELLKRHFELEIRRACKALKFSHNIMATAIVYFKRFFLRHTVLDFQPQSMMLTAIFLAIKAEASPFGEVDQLVKQFKDLYRLEDRQLVENEMLLMMGNKFHVTVYHPYRALRGLVRTFEGYVLKQGVDATRAKAISDNLYHRALEVVHMSLTTDCCLMCHPAQIALAAAYMAMDDDLALRDAPGPLHLATSKVDRTAFVNSVLAAGDDAEQKQTRTVVGVAIELIKAALAAPRLNNTAKKLEQRRKRLCNPAFVKGTKEYEARQAKKEAVRQARKAAKRAAKAAKAKEAASNARALFGGGMQVDAGASDRAGTRAVHPGLPA